MINNESLVSSTVEVNRNVLSRPNYETRLKRNDSQNVPVTAVLFGDRTGIEAPNGSIGCNRLTVSTRKQAMVDVEFGRCTRYRGQ